jgi:uroporphyrinogen-III synthase
MSKAPCHLQGLGVLVTRPAEQAQRLGEAIEAAHGRPLLFPCVEIAAAADPAAVRTQLQTAADYDLLIFISVNAVQYAFPLLPDTLPLNQQVAAVGAATAAQLEAYGLEPTLVPERFDSEGLLALAALADMTAKRVLVLRGNGGRELLADTLRQRGAQVDYAEVYQRLLPRRSAGNLVAGWESWVDAVTVTSIEILDNLFTLLGAAGASKLQKTPLVVVSERLAEHARARGCRKLYLAAGASDHALMQALCALA